ncbi:hypothetical protein KSS87_000944 [Heliosperma pusillum]|nr:hypothetical protein KSS87_000944 [Heliosperma pusillum]
MRGWCVGGAGGWLLLKEVVGSGSGGSWLVGRGWNVSDIVSYTSSNVITSQVVILEANASQSVSEISAIAVEVSVPVTSNVIQDNVVEEVVDEEEAEGSSSNKNRTFDCPIHLKPSIGMVFDKLELGIGFYEAYAKECGFVSRLGSQKEELKAACFSCGVEDIQKDPEHAIQYISIIDRERDKVYVVGLKTDESKIVCTCKKFERHGILCRHALSVEVQKNKVSELWSELFTCVLVVEQSHVYCDELMGMLRGFKERVLAVTSVIDDSGNSGIGKKMDKNAEIGMLLGTSLPSEIKVLPPRQCKNKGSGKRLISQREKAGEISKRPLRRCKACGEMANHDSRNCDKKTTDDE